MATRGFEPAKRTRICIVNLEYRGINGESDAQFRRLCDIANRGIGLAGVGDEEQGKQVLGMGRRGW